MKSYLSIIFIFVFSFIVFGQDLPESATFTVTNLNDSGAGSLRQAINDASLVAGDDTINFQSDLSGAIALTSGELLINSNVTISGTSSPITITRSTAAGTPNFRILTVFSGASVSINNLTISGGNLAVTGALGGGIYNAGTLSLTNVSVSNNFAGCDGTNCTRRENVLNGSGGGIYNVGSLTITNSNVNDNKAGFIMNNFMLIYQNDGEGGGITNTGVLTLINSSVRNNLSSGSPGNTSVGDAFGGGIVNTSTGTANIINSAVRDNVASASRSFGGGIYNSNILNVTNSEISTNFASGGGNTPSISAGGGIYNSNELVITNSTVSNNKSFAQNQQYGDRGGGGIFSRGSAVIRNSTVSGNSFQCGGGGCAGNDTQAQSGGINSARLSNTIIAANSPFDVSGQVTSEGYNLIGKVGTSSGWLSTDILNRDARLAPLADNGGPTQTQALLPDSPAINAGNNADAPATDQRGFARIVGGIIDIGAFESATTCDFTINPTNQFISSFGGNITVNVTGAASCSRTAVSTLEWISVTSGSSGSGNGTVTLSIQANTGSARTGTVTIAGQTFTVNQSSGCTFSLSSTSSAVIPSTGGGGTFDIQSGAGCAYTASTTDTWITIDGSVSGTGSGTISYTVAANTGAARTGTITVGGQTFTVNQAAVKSRKRVRFI